MRIGIYGGSFNPPHNGHKLVINYLLDNEILDKVYVVPTGRNYVKPGLEKFEHRRAMLDLALSSIDRAEIVDIEELINIEIQNNYDFLGINNYIEKHHKTKVNCEIFHQVSCIQPPAHVDTHVLLHEL